MSESTQDTGGAGVTDVFTAYVHVADETGGYHAFGPGDPIPAWASPLVGDHVRTRPTSYVPVVPDTPAQLFAEPEPVAELPTPPPTSGPGSGQAAWFDWASATGAVTELGIGPSWSRQDIQDALIRAGYLTDPE